MEKLSPNHYEQAFGNWLIDNRIRHVKVDQQKRAAFGRLKLKSFDYLLYPQNQKIIIAEVKGKLFKGASLANLGNMQCWVGTEDIDGLTHWQKLFGPDHIAVFIFAYKIQNVDVDLDGRDVYNFDSDRYIFFAVRLDDYRRFMKRRSPKWKTLTLPADKFRQCAVQMQNLLF